MYFRHMIMFLVDIKQHQAKIYRNKSYLPIIRNWKLKMKRKPFSYSLYVYFTSQYPYQYWEAKCVCVCVFDNFLKFDALFVRVRGYKFYGEFLKIDLPIDYDSIVSPYIVQLTLFTSQKPHYTTQIGFKVCILNRFELCICLTYTCYLIQVYTFISKSIIISINATLIYWFALTCLNI